VMRRCRTPLPLHIRVIMICNIGYSKP
jgi:hypothetical protein